VYRKKLIILQKLPGRHPVSHGKVTGMTDESKFPTALLLMLVAVVILLMVAIVGLFLRMNQLQQAVLAALASSQVGMPEQEVGLAVETHHLIPYASISGKER